MGIWKRVVIAREKRRLKMRRVALTEARKIAVLLGRRFGARKVILYGSLARGEEFDSRSDIDLAVLGLGDGYYRAYGYCLRFSPFPIELRAYEDMPREFRREVDRKGRLLYEKR